MVERPGVVSLEAQVGLDVVERERVGRRKRPDEFALRAEQVRQFATGNAAARDDPAAIAIACNESVGLSGVFAPPMRTFSATSPWTKCRRSRENSSSTPCVRKFSTSRVFKKSGRPTRLSQTRVHRTRQHQQKHADATPAETYAAFAPETGSHITECSPEW